MALDRFLGLKPHDIVMERVTDFREQKGRLWQSNSFLSHVGGCMLILHAQCVRDRHKQPLMRVYLSGSEVHVSHVPVLTFSVTLQVLNQRGSDNHYTREFKLVILARNIDSFTQMAKSNTYDFITFAELFRRDIGVQYVTYDRIKFRMWLHVMIDN